VANLIWGYATLRRMPGDSTWAALETAAGRVAQDTNSQGVANLIWGYATLGRMPGDSTWAALETAAVRVALDMNSQEVANILFGYATLFILQDVDQPSIYAVVWNLVCGLEVRDFNREQLCMLFHVHLMHQFFGSLRSATVKYPAWLMTEARDAWMHNVQNNTTVSRPQQELASVFESLGVQQKLERVTADGYFSMDIYLPDHDVAVEFDGPTHYYHNSDSSSSRDALMTRTAKTELRDLFLAKQCAKVVTVPWFEWRALNSPEARSAYVRKKLAKEASVHV
jgi:very-short-patch-repair endonuclease